MKNLKNFKADNIPPNLASNEELTKALNKYGNMNEDALVEQLVTQIRTSKQNGTYNPEQMQGYITLLSPHLSSSQSEKLKNIIKIIDAENV